MGPIILGPPKGPEMFRVVAQKKKIQAGLSGGLTVQHRRRLHSARYHEPFPSLQVRGHSPYLAAQWIRMYILYNIVRVGAIIIHGFAGEIIVSNMWLALAREARLL